MPSGNTGGCNLGVSCLRARRPARPTRTSHWFAHAHPEAVAALQGANKKMFPGGFQLGPLPLLPVLTNFAL